MLSLPPQAFEHIMLFATPKSLFPLKRVCKRFEEDLSKESLWKKISKIHHTMAPVVDDYKSFMKDVIKNATPTPLSDFEFTFSIQKGDEKIGHVAWERGELPTKKIISNKRIFDEVAGILEKENADDFVMRLYVTKHCGQSKKYKCHEFKFHYTQELVGWNTLILRKNFGIALGSVEIIFAKQES